VAIRDAGSSPKDNGTKVRIQASLLTSMGDQIAWESIDVCLDVKVAAA
jgi:hypothetical protein